LHDFICQFISFVAAKNSLHCISQKLESLSLCHFSEQAKLVGYFQFSKFIGPEPFR